MKAIEFFNELQKDNPIYDSGMVTIKEIGLNDKTYFVIHKDGAITPSNPFNRIDSINELKGEYEYYSSVQYVKCGYIIIKELNSYYRVKEIISCLHDRFNSEEYNYELTPEEKHYLCGGSSWQNGLTEGFSYYAPSGIEVEIKTIPYLCKYNNLYRKGKNKKCLPFKKEISKENAIYVEFVVDIDSDRYTNDNIDLALNDLLNQFNTKKIEWVNMNLKQNIYY